MSKRDPKKIISYFIFCQKAAEVNNNCRDYRVIILPPCYHYSLLLLLHATTTTTSTTTHNLQYNNKIVLP